MSFGGFTKEAPEFLFKNKVNNSKDWYEEHKGEYKKYVYNPFAGLIAELAPVMTGIDDKFITVPSKLISRVRRDTRFSKDKSLYRDNAWLVFLRDKSRMSTSPCYWFEISQSGSSHGVGFYGAGSETMIRMREMIIHNHPLFMKALNCYESQHEFIIGGEMYKKSKYADRPENIRSWLDRKNIYFESKRNDFTVAFSKELPGILKKGFSKLKPIYDFICAADGYASPV